MNSNKYFVIIVLMMVSVFTSSASLQTYLGNFSGYSKNGNEITVHTGNSALRFVFFKPNLVRVEYLPTSSTPFPKSLVVIRRANEHINYSIADGDSTLTISTSSLRITCRKYPLRVSFASRKNRLLLKEPSSGGISNRGMERIANFVLPADEHFYGTGERGISLDLRGKAFDSFNEQHGGYPTIGGIPPTMNVNVPFIVSTNHYGIYFDDTYKGHFDIGHSIPDRFTYGAYGGELTYYFIYDCTMSAILSDYTWLTGRAPLLPEWAYGYIQSKFGYRNVNDAERMIHTMRRDSIPCDAIVLDLYWFRVMGDLWWNTQDWPDPKKIMSNFLSQGFKTIVITEPYIAQPSLNFLGAVRRGYFAKDSVDSTYILSNWWSCHCDAGLIDITDPAARRWLWHKYLDIFKSGVSGIWTDLMEPERDSPDMLFHMGPDLEVHNIYDFLWAKLIYDGYRKYFPNRRLFNLTRSGYAGIQRFGVVTWSGDVAKTFGGLALQVPILLNMGMSGLAYHNSDIGGFNPGKTTTELYTRWMEFGAFCPVMRAHGYDGDGGTEPWAFGTSAKNMVRKIIQMRYSLLSYNYTMAHETYESGIPLARPLVLEYTDDRNIYNDSNAYMWGDDFLVAPIVEAGQRTKTLYLPEGKWIDFWNDRMYNGGDSITVPAPIDQIPLFVKAGSIIPMLPVRESIGSSPEDSMYLEIYPDPKMTASFKLYEDDGHSLDYQKGAFATTLFQEKVEAKAKSSKMIISIGTAIGNYDGKPSHRYLQCDVHGIAYLPGSVSVGGVKLSQMKSGAVLRESKSGYVYDRESKILLIKFWVKSDSSDTVVIHNVATVGN